MKHNMQDIIKILIQANIPIRLTGESGTGKTTILMNIAKELNIPYTFITGTRQTSIGHILGFMGVTGEYVTTPFRIAYEEGHIFDINEINAMDVNTLIILNSLENNVIQFPDGYCKPPHKNFRLVCTSNPNTSEFGARDELDFSTANRFQTVVIKKDEKLELALADKQATEDIEWLKGQFKNLGITTSFTMRDVTRLALIRTLDINGTDPLLMLIDTQTDEVVKTITEEWNKVKAKREEERLERERQEAFDEKSRFEMDNFDDFMSKVEEGK